MPSQPGAMERILDYDWPGNVRELENVIERAIILSDRSEIQVKDLPPEVRDFHAKSETSADDRRLPDQATLPIPGLSAGDRMADSGFKVRQMRAMEFIKTNGFITNKYYSQLAEISERQALRELSELVDTGKLLRIGKGRACRYVLNLPVEM